MTADDVKKEPENPSVKKKGEIILSDVEKKIEMARAITSESLTESKRQFEEIDKMFASMKNMQNDLDEKLEAIRAEAKRHNVDLERYLKNVPDFTAKEKELAEMTAKELRRRINEVLPAEACVQRPAKTKEKLTKERKGKTRGVRNKWIPMP